MESIIKYGMGLVTCWVVEDGNIHTHCQKRLGKTLDFIG